MLLSPVRCAHRLWLCSGRGESVSCHNGTIQGVSQRTPSVKRKVEESGCSPPLRTIHVLIVSWSCICARGRGRLTQLELWSSTASCLLKVPKHRAQGAGDGRRARRLAESEPEPLEAHLVIRCTTARAGWSWRAASCQSRRSAARPAASGEESAAAPRRCHRTSASSNASCVRPASQRQPVVGAVGAGHHKRPRGRFGRAI